MSVIFFRLIKFLIVCLFLFSYGVASAITPKPPQLSAQSYVLMDFNSGKVIAQSNADLTVAPASLTKMMTSYVVSDALRSGKISRSDEVKISYNAYASNPFFKGSSLMWLDIGEVVTVDKLIKGLIIASGNDAAVALAEHVAGSEEKFVEIMNEQARTLGMTSTYFENSHGLTSTSHKTTANDMAKLANALIRDFPEEYHLYKEKQITHNNIPSYNRHPLLSDPVLNVDGIKTGHTEEAGYCLVSSAVKDNMRLISVVMNTNSEETRKTETKKLLSYGFRFYETVKALEAGKQLHLGELWMGEEDEIKLGVLNEVYVTVQRGNVEKLKAHFIVEKDLMAPINKGDMVGRVFFVIDDETVAEHSLVALESVEEAGFFGRTADSIGKWFSDLFD